MHTVLLVKILNICFEISSLCDVYRIHQFFQLTARWFGTYMYLSTRLYIHLVYMGRDNMYSGAAVYALHGMHSMYILP